MARILIGIIAALACSLPGKAQYSEVHHSLVKGSELYANCQSYEHIAQMSKNQLVDFAASLQDQLHAAACLSYVEGVVDTLPVSAHFHPSGSVKASEFVDVVFNYLKKHPKTRNQPASLLCEAALTKAFGG